MPAVKLDENVPDSVGAVLREGGHDVAFAQDEHLIRHMAKTLSGLLADERLRGRLWVLDESRLRIWPHAGPA